jgi:hypothetical protein
MIAATPTVQYTPADFRTTAAVFRTSRDKLREDIQLLQKDRAKLKLELKESLAKKPTSSKNRDAPPASSSDSKPKRVVVFDQLETADLLLLQQFKPFKNKCMSDHFFSEKLNASIALLHSESGTSEALSISVADVLAQQDTKEVTKNVKVLIKYAELYAAAASSPLKSL